MCESVCVNMSVCMYMCMCVYMFMSLCIHNFCICVCIPYVYACIVCLHMCVVCSLYSFLCFSFRIWIHVGYHAALQPPCSDLAVDGSKIAGDH